MSHNMTVLLDDTQCNPGSRIVCGLPLRKATPRWKGSIVCLLGNGRKRLQTRYTRPSASARMTTSTEVPTTKSKVFDKNPPLYALTGAEI
jgi:hypothetical protein